MSNVKGISLSAQAKFIHIGLCKIEITPESLVEHELAGNLIAYKNGDYLVRPLPVSIVADKADTLIKVKTLAPSSTCLLSASIDTIELSLAS